jgi:hypothetical protein
MVLVRVALRFLSVGAVTPTTNALYVIKDTILTLQPVWHATRIVWTVPLLLTAKKLRMVTTSVSTTTDHTVAKYTLVKVPASRVNKIPITV